MNPQLKSTMRLGRFMRPAGSIGLAFTAAFFLLTLLQPISAATLVEITEPERSALLSKPLPPTVAVSGITDGFIEWWFSGDAENSQDATLGDIDLDGDLDLAVANDGSPSKIYLNINGTLQTAASWASQSSEAKAVRFADMNKDGRLDLIIATKNANEIYINSTAGISTAPSWQSFHEDETLGIAVGDLDNDGNFDLVTANYSKPNRIYYNSSGLSTTNDWNDGNSFNTTGVALADFDLDGDLDIAFSNGIGDDTQIYKNSGGIFAPAWGAGIPMSNTLSIAWADFNRDGFADLALGNDGQNFVFRNNDGLMDLSPMWTSSYSSTTEAIAWSDVDGDGDLDLITSNVGAPNRIYINDFNVISTTAAWESPDINDSYGLAIGDINGDSALDIVATNQWAPNRGYQNVLGTLSSLPDWAADFVENTTSLAFGDMNQDGYVDLAVGNAQNVNRIYLNSNGLLQTVHAWESDYGNSNSYETRSVRWGDVDNDGDLDLAVGNLSGPDEIYYNFNGYLENMPSWESSYMSSTSSIAWGDISGNGYLDLVVGNEYHRNFVYFNSGTGLETIPSWRSSEIHNTYAIALGDIDSDGDLDLATGDINGSHLYLNDRGTLSSTPAWTSQGGISDYPYGIAFADIDNDGDLDLVVGNWGGNMVYRNNSGTLDDSAAWVSGDGESTRSISLGDMDNDGDIDLIAGNGYQASLPRNNKIYINRDNMFEITASWVDNFDENTRATAVADVDNDGDLDLVTGQYGLPVTLFKNNIPGEPTYPGKHVGVAIPATIAQANFYATGQIEKRVIIPITYTLHHPAGIPFQQIRAYFSPDGGGKWYDAIPASGTETTIIASAPFEPPFPFTPDPPPTTPTYCSSPMMPIPNDEPGGVFDVISVVDNALITDLKVFIDINHQDANDIKIVLTHLETASTVTLMDQPCTNGPLKNQLSEIIFDDDGPETVANFCSYFPNADIEGHFQPKESLNLFNGEDIEGNWQLQVQDTGLMDQGAINSWCIETAVQGGPEAVDDVYNASEGTLLRIPAPGVLANDHGQNGATGWNQVAVLNSMPVTGTLFFYPDGSFDFYPPLDYYGVLSFTYFISGLPPSNPAKVFIQIAPDHNNHVFYWDMFQSGFFGQTDNMVFRIEAMPLMLPVTSTVAGPYEAGNYSATSYPFRVRGTQVRVLSGTTPISNALVYRLPAGQSSNAELLSSPASGNPFRTDPFGYLQGRGNLSVGDRIVALYPITSTDYYTLYYTSAAPTVESMDVYTITAGGVHTLSVSSANPLILFDVDISLEWDASNDGSFLTDLQTAIGNSSGILFDISNGQMALGNVRIHQERKSWLSADTVILASNSIRPSASLGGFVVTPTHDIVSATKTITDAYQPGLVRMGVTWDPYGQNTDELSLDWWRTYAHELSHYFLYLPDNYVGVQDGVLVMPDCQGSFMTNSQDDAYSEFLTAADWTGNCLNTVAEVTTGRSDWETILKYYPMLNDSPLNSGPGILPLNVTNITYVEAPVNSEAIAARNIDLRDAVTGNLLTGDNAEGFVRKAMGTPGDLTDDQIVALGTASGGGSFMKFRAADPNDTLCVIDSSTQYVGCSAVTESTTSLQLTELSDWQPDIFVSPISSRTLAITVTQLVTSGNLNVQILPGYGEPQNSLINCRTPNVPIPDGPPSGVEDTITITDGGTVADINLSISVTHAAVGDLDIMLEHMATGTSVSLKMPDSCTNPDVDVIFDDDGSGSVNDACATTSPAINGTLIPDQSLAGFNGELISGDWTLRINDQFPGLNGELVEWCLNTVTEASDTTHSPWTAMGVISPGLPMTYTAVLTIDYPAFDGYVRVWEPGASPEKEALTQYFINVTLWSGNRAAWGGNHFVGWGGNHFVGWGGNRAAWGGNRAAWGAPMSSGDGQVTIFNTDDPYADTGISSLQAMAKPPQLPLWLTPVGEAYRLVKSTTMTQTIARSVAFSYLQRDVPDGYEYALHIYYSADEGKSWQRLNTDLNDDHNRAAARMPDAADGIYSLMATIDIAPFATGWNLFGYPVPQTRPITETVASIEESYTSIYSYNPLGSPQWTLYDATVPPAFDLIVNTLRQMEFTKGYWIYATEPITLFVGVPEENGAAAMDKPTIASSQFPPATFYGEVNAGAGFAPAAGMAVEAWINGNLCGQSTLVDQDGQLIYSLQAASENLWGAPNNCGNSSATVAFWIDGIAMDHDHAWSNSQAWHHPLTNIVCASPPPITALDLSLAGNDVLLSWEDSGADSYELWESAANPFFTPGLDCNSSAECTVAATTSMNDSNAAAAAGSSYYVVLGSMSCGSTSTSSNRTAVFNFTIESGN